jgi:hypothetical protein
VCVRLGERPWRDGDSRVPGREWRRGNSGDCAISVAVSDVAADAPELGRSESVGPWLAGCAESHATTRAVQESSTQAVRSRRPLLTSVLSARTYVLTRPPCRSVQCEGRPSRREDDGGRLLQTARSMSNFRRSRTMLMRGRARFRRRGSAALPEAR